MDKTMVIPQSGEGKKKTKEKERQQTSIPHKVLTVVGIILCVILLPILIINCTLIARSYMDQDQIPSIGGYLPLIVLTDSMSTGIQSGDLVIYHTIEAEDITKGDVIAFYDPAGSGDSIVTHRVIQVTTKDGELAFQTKGDASDTADEALVPADHIVGIYCSKIAGAGNVALFFQTTKGLILCVIVPLFLLVGYDMIRRQMYERRRRAEADALRAELETLRSEQAEK